MQQIDCEQKDQWQIITIKWTHLSSPRTSPKPTWSMRCLALSTQPSLSAAAKIDWRWELCGERKNKVIIIVILNQEAQWYNSDVSGSVFNFMSKRFRFGSYIVYSTVKSSWKSYLSLLRSKEFLVEFHEPTPL